MNWSGVALTVVILALVGVSVWMASQLYPEWFKLGSGDTLPVAQQEIPADMPGKKPRETEPGETREAPASAEILPLPEDTSRTTSAKTAAESDETIAEKLETAPAKAPPAEEDEVTRLLAAAEADLKARRLTSPAGNNAWDRYQRVLDIDPTNREAVQGMDRVIESYMELFGIAVEQKDFEQADSYLGRIDDLHPDSPFLMTGRQQLEDAKQARAKRLAEQERQRQAEKEAHQAELERQRIAQEIKSHWESFESAIQMEDLGEASDILAKIRELNPDETGLTPGEQRLVDLERQLIDKVIKDHWVAFEAALEMEDLDQAANILASVRDLNPETPRLADQKQSLDEARQRALEREFAGEMVSIPGAIFRMGDLNGSGDDDERPVHSVNVSPFRLGKSR